MPLTSCKFGDILGYLTKQNFPIHPRWNSCCCKWELALKLTWLTKANINWVIPHYLVYSYIVVEDTYLLRMTLGYFGIINHGCWYQNIPLASLIIRQPDFITSHQHCLFSQDTKTNCYQWSTGWLKRAKSQRMRHRFWHLEIAFSTFQV